MDVSRGHWRQQPCVIQQEIICGLKQEKCLKSLYRVKAKTPVSVLIEYLINKPESKSKSKVQSQNNQKSNSKKERGISTL